MTAERLPDPTMFHHPDGITAVDADYVRPRLAAAHVIAHAGRAAVVDVGTNHSVPLVLAALERLGMARSAVDFVFLTHVHLDHAGGAGELMQALPQAQAIVHPRGLGHMVDPTRLIAASIQVYGEAIYRSLYGDLKPIPAERIRAMSDGERVSLAGRELLLFETPGHALHHYCLLDVAHGNVFTGDTFGMSFRELDTAAGAFIVPVTPPTQFDPEQLVASVRRIMGFAPEAAYLMHFSRVTGLPRLAEELERQIGEFVAIATRHAQASDRVGAIRSDLRALWLARLREHGVTFSESQIDQLLRADLRLNAQGLVAWLERAERARPA